MLESEDKWRASWLDHFLEGFTVIADETAPIASLATNLPVFTIYWLCAIGRRSLILCKKRTLLADYERQWLAVMGKVLGREALEEICRIVAPETILRWLKEWIALQVCPKGLSKATVFCKVYPIPYSHPGSDWKGASRA
jgi:hypothetical protein